MKIDDLTVGIDFKRCSECEYKNNDIREELLVIAGARAGYMYGENRIELNCGNDWEHKLACNIRRIVDGYLLSRDDVNFDLYIESALEQTYGGPNV